jgi:hypothetical protein
MTAVGNLAHKRHRNEPLKRTAENMKVMTFRVRNDRAALLRKAQRATGNTLSQGALLDRAIELLIVDMRAKGEMR